MALNLPAIVRQRRIRRDVTLRPIHPSKVQATSLANILLSVPAIWQASLPRIMAGYTPPTRDALTTDSLDDIRNALASITGEVERFMVTVSANLSGWAARQEAWHRGKWIAAVNAGAGVDLSTVLTALPVQETLDTWLARNVALVRDVSAQTQARIADIVYREWSLGTSARDIGKMLDDAVGRGRARSRRIAADQTVKLSSQLDRERQAEAGIEQFKWRHSGKLHARPWHKARDGDIFDLKTGKPADGGKPIPPDDRAGVPPFCGCVEQAYIAWLDAIE